MHVGANDIALMKIVKKFKGGLWKKISLPMKDYKHINVKDYSSVEWTKLSISGDLVNLKCRQAGWSCRDRKDWKTCENEKRLQETMTKFIKFCFTPGHTYEGILDTLLS